MGDLRSVISQDENGNLSPFRSDLYQKVVSVLSKLSETDLKEELRYLTSQYQQECPQYYITHNNIQEKNPLRLSLIVQILWKLTFVDDKSFDHFLLECEDKVLNFDMLPPELKLNIINKLNTRELVNIGMTNKEMKTHVDKFKTKITDSKLLKRIVYMPLLWFYNTSYMNLLQINYDLYIIGNINGQVRIKGNVEMVSKRINGIIIRNDISIVTEEFHLKRNNELDGSVRVEMKYRGTNNVLIIKGYINVNEANFDIRDEETGKTVRLIFNEDNRTIIYDANRR